MSSNSSTISQNPFESGARKNIPAVLIYARNAGQILMIHRDAPSRAPLDYHAGKWNGLGGKCELNESAPESCVREFKEEAGLHFSPERFKMLGILQFPNFKPQKSEDWSVFVFVTDVTDAERARIIHSAEEGSLHWIPEGDLLRLNLWEGDHHFITYVVKREIFSGAIWYENQKVVRTFWFNFASKLTVL